MTPRAGLGRTGARGVALAILFTATGALGPAPLPLQAQASGDASPPLTPELRAIVVQGIGKALREVYVYEDLARDMAALLTRKLEAGAYDGIVEQVALARALTEDLRSVANDLHLSGRVRHVHPGENAERGTGEGEEENAHGSAEVRRRTNFGIRKAEILEGNVGYLAIDSFDGGPEAGAAVVAAMNFLGNAEALVLDLRTNGGGGPSVIQMVYGFLLDGPTHVTGFYTRETHTHQQFWSPPYVPGPSLAHVPVFVLVGPRTFSAAEAFAFSMQTLERGTIVGERTPGGSHPVRPIPLEGTEFVVQVPFARTVDPRTDGDWEGTGILPDILAPVEEALEVAHLEALAALRDREPDPTRQRALDLILDRRQALRDPPVLEAGAMADYAGRYSGDVEAEIVLEEDGLVMKIRGMRFSSLTFLGGERFALERSLGQLVFSRDGEGKVAGFEALVGEAGSTTFRRAGG
jgi:hypothetical protein